MEQSGLREFVVCDRCIKLGFYPLNARQPIVGATAGGYLILACGHHQQPHVVHGPISRGPQSDSMSGKVTKSDTFCS